MKKTYRYKDNDVVIFNKELAQDFLRDISWKKGDSFPLLLVFADEQLPEQIDTHFLTKLLELPIPTVNIYSKNDPDPIEKLIDGIIIANKLEVLWTVGDTDKREALESFFLTGGPGDRKSTIKSYLIIILDGNEMSVKDTLHEVVGTIEELND
ncbi:MAG: hypothetical protein Q8Q05_01435 [bacterium]|nr:hypothetical protein [bacterium]